MFKMNEVFVPMNTLKGIQRECQNKLTHLDRTTDFVLQKLNLNKA